ncbi:MAG: response regulator [Myxococcales bacterium]
MESTQQMSEGRGAERVPVLVVDDDVEMRELLCELLNLNGFKPLRAYNGREAMVFLHSQAPRFVVLDLMMPEMTGWDVLHEMRADPALATVPVIVVAGRPPKSSGVERKEIAAYFQKPLDVERFEEVLEVLRRVRPMPARAR